MRLRVIWGQLAGIIDAKYQETTYDYDLFDRLICTTYPDDSNEVFIYDKNSNVISKKNRKNETIYLEYDVLERIWYLAASAGDIKPKNDFPIYQPLGIF